MITLGALAASHPDLTLTHGAPEVVLLDVTFDSREVRPGTLFVALAGARTDGHDYLPDVLAAGAAAVLVEPGRAPEGVPALEASNPREVLGHIAAAFFGQPSHELTVVGVTGTNGKTTTSAILESLLLQAGEEVGVIGTIGHRFAGRTIPSRNTTPESLVLQRLMRQRRDAGVARLVMEVSSHGLAAHRVTGTRFDIGVFTNLRQDHLDFHGTMDAYRDTKARLFLELLPASSGQPLAILNVDDPEGRRLEGLIDRGRVRVQTLGSNDADWSVKITARDIDGSSFELCSQGAPPWRLHTPMLGDFNVVNAASAALVARDMGVDPGVIARALAHVVGVPGRMERVGGAPVFVDYAHTPDALERALETLRPHAKRALIVVFGCGGDRDRDKRPRMGAIAARLATDVIVTSDNPRRERPGAILDDIMAGIPGEGARVIEAREDAIQEALSGADLSRDVVLIAGKGHETYQEIGDTRFPFDDREHARRALQAGGEG